MISQKAKLHNRFDFEIYDTETGETEYAQAENIVLNKMWDYLCAGSAYFNYINVGTGSGTLSPTRTSMFSYLANKAATAVETVYDTDSKAHMTKKAVFSETEGNGLWSEVSISQTGGGNFVTHAAITDSEGNPITVNKTNTKIITIYATVFAEVTSTGGVPLLFNGSANRVFGFLFGGPPVMMFGFSTHKRMDGNPSVLCRISHLEGTTWSADTANKRRRSALARVAVGSSNHPIRGIIVSANVEATNRGIGGTGLPVSGVFESKEYVGIAVGTGDGYNKQFDLPVPYPMADSETVYVAGVAKSKGVDYTMHYGARNGDTTIVDTSPGNGFIYISETFEEIIELPQPSGSESTITAVELKNTNAYSFNLGGYKVDLSVDGETWVGAGELISGWGLGAVATLNSFAPGPYKYVKVKLFKNPAGNGDQYITHIKVFATPPASKHITFLTAPANGAPITADFSTDYINKTSNFVLDVQAEVVFGEGV